jgi:chromosome segregation ATPase
MRLVLLLGVLTLVPVVGGCASAPYSKGESASAGLSAVANTLEQADKSLAACTAALADLPAGQGDLKQRYDLFVAAVDRLASDAKRVRGEADAMKAESESYFKWWEQQIATISNEDLKTASAQRRQAIRKDFAEVDASFQDLRTKFTPYMNDLRDLQTALGTSLTPAMVTSVQPTIARATKSGVEARSALNKLMAQYRALGLSMSAK